MGKLITPRFAPTTLSSEGNRSKNITLLTCCIEGLVANIFPNRCGYNPLTTAFQVGAVKTVTNLGPHTTYKMFRCSSRGPLPSWAETWDKVYQLLPEQEHLGSDLL